MNKKHPEALAYLVLVYQIVGTWVLTLSAQVTLNLLSGQGWPCTSDPCSPTSQVPGLQAYTTTLSFSGGCWGLKPGLRTCYIGPPPTEPHPQPSTWALLWRLNYKHKGLGTSGVLQFTEEMHALQRLRWGGLMFHPVHGTRSGNICMNSLLVLTEWGSVCTLCLNPLILSPPPSLLNLEDRHYCKWIRR